MGFGDGLKQAEMDMRMARASYEQAQREAEGAVRRAEKARDARMRDIEKKMRSVERESARKVASCKGVSLYVDRVVYAGTILKLDTALVATADVRGGFYPGGISGYPRDLRKLFILIESPAGTILRECDPHEEKKVRDFVALINATAAKAGEVKENASRQLERLQAELDKEKANTDEIEAAKSALEAVRSDTLKVDAARKAFEDLKSQVSPEELAAYNYDQIQSGRKILLWMLVAFVALIIIVIALVAYLA